MCKYIHVTQYYYRPRQNIRSSGTLVLKKSPYYKLTDIMPCHRLLIGSTCLNLYYLLFIRYLSNLRPLQDRSGATGMGTNKESTRGAEAARWPQPGCGRSRSRVACSDPSRRVQATDGHRTVDDRGIRIDMIDRSCLGGSGGCAPNRRLLPPAFPRSSRTRHARS